MRTDARGLTVSERERLLALARKYGLPRPAKGPRTPPYPTTEDKERIKRRREQSGTETPKLPESGARED